MALSLSRSLPIWIRIKIFPTLHHQNFLGTCLYLCQSGRLWLGFSHVASPQFCFDNFPPHFVMFLGVLFDKDRQDEKGDLLTRFWISIQGVGTQNGIHTTSKSFPIESLEIREAGGNFASKESGIEKITSGNESHPKRKSGSNLPQVSLKYSLW